MTSGSRVHADPSSSGGRQGRRPVRVKVCGLTRPEDAVIAERSGADAVGLVFAASKRRVDEAAAREVIAALGPFVVKVGVFRDQPLAEVMRLVGDLRLDLAQLHGSEDAGFAQAVRELVPVMRAVAFEDAREPSVLADYPADAFLLDARAPGSGTSFAWDAARAWRGHPRLVVAGGLTPDNVGAAVAALAPYAVDVSTGVESAPGIKDGGLLEAFIRAAKNPVVHSPRQPGSGT